MPIARVSGLLAGSWAILPSNFRTGAKNRYQKWGVPILDAPEERRDDFVAPYFKRAKKDQLVVILKAREPARIMIAIGATACSVAPTPSSMLVAMFEGFT
jgi:hypothetical protein